MHRILAVCVALGLATFPGRTLAREDAPARSADEAAVREASQAFARAFQAGEAQAVADAWTEEGEYADEGSEPVRGRAAVREAYSRFFASRPELKVESRTNSVRFVGQDAALEEGTFTVKPKAGTPVASRFSTLYVRQGGRWLIALLREWPDAGPPRPTLEDLAWLVGTWESDGTGPKVRVTFEWADNKAFLRGRFWITPEGAPGTQILAVDRSDSVLRAWTFDADGGFGEATWARDGDRWAIHSGGTVASGGRASALNFLTPEGPDAFNWRSVRRTLDDKDLPDLGPIRVHRVASPK